MSASIQPSAAVRVQLAERSYNVTIGAGLLESLGERLALLVGQGRRAFLVYDAGLPDDLIIAASRSLAHHGFLVSAASVRAEESQKTLGVAARLLVDLAESKHERTDPVVALGGGITGDIAGYLAATYMRGVPIMQAPTTLLSMVDASVGGKTGVNLLTSGGLRKNLVGAFWQPIGVLAEVRTLESLPLRHLRSGLAECIKHAMLGAMLDDPDLFAFTERAIPGALARDGATLSALIARNVSLKARVVERDERESPAGNPPSPGDTGRVERALLNLGHTFAHAIEPLAGLSPDGDPANAPLHHGEAVALGLLAACAAGEALGETQSGVRGHVARALALAGLPTKVRGLPPTAQILDAMRGDKKVAGGRLRLVVPTELGRARVVSDPPDAAVAEGIDAIRA